MNRRMKTDREKQIDMTERRVVTKRKAQAHQNALKKVVFLFAVVVILGSGFFGNTLMNAMAEIPVETSSVPYYKGIIIEEGDTLWSIAAEYAQETGLSVSEYVNLLKQMNGLSNDTIHAGRHLTIRYYGSES